ncbi:ankyrin [Plenodomus tracheiphilus IPT5]|uniref:Ankyrin n=1 Tax=Plenodomus tracheiphilus IPT5 TaxID=1408161 RepID=A0A6A7AXU3_9PLEO|nr:ankyrin [Plenodomus tracheiphilus IPT5]
MSLLESVNTLDVPSYSAGLWCTRNSIDSLETANLSFHAASQPQVHGLEDVVRTVQILNVRRFPYNKIQHGERVGEGETFWVEQCYTDGKAVAVKHLKVSRRENDGHDFLQRVNSLLLELRIMRHEPLRDHPNILSLVGYGWNVEGGSILPYILVDYCANGNLRQYLVKRRISPIHKEILIANVATGIHALHLAGVIHGDVKLDNVLVVDAPSAPLAKLCDFGHSVVIGPDSDTHRSALYRGTNRYNAPEVFLQSEKRILQTEMRKCDVWAFGLLAWEVLLDGIHYTNRVAGMTDDHSAGHPPSTLEPDAILTLALSATRTSTDDIQRAIYKNLFRRALVADPNQRSGQLDSLLITSKWRQTTTSSNITQLVLHADASEWSYEVLRPGRRFERHLLTNLVPGKIFRHENDREIFWVHKQHIFRDLIRIVNDPTESVGIKGTAAWQAAICLATGFGISVNVPDADKYFAQATELGAEVAHAFGSLVIRSGSDHNGDTYTEFILNRLSSKFSKGPHIQKTQESRLGNSTKHWTTSNSFWSPELENHEYLHVPGESNITFDDHLFCQTLPLVESISSLVEAIQQKDWPRILDIHKAHPLDVLQNDWSGEPFLILGLQTRDTTVVRTLIACGASPESKGAGGRNSFHWLFMLDHDATWVARESLGTYRRSTSLDEMALDSLEIFSQWALKLRGTPLAHAISVGSYDTVVALLDLGANPLATDYAPITPLVSFQSSWTPVHVAIKYQRPDILELLQDAADRVALSEYGQLHRVGLGAIALCVSTDLELMAMHGRKRDADLMKTVELLGPPYVLGEQSDDGHTAIMASLERHDFRVLASLLQRNAALASTPSKSPNPLDPDTFHYPIHHAAYVASRRDDLAALEALELIFKYNPRALYSRDSVGRTPLHIAASGSSPLTALFILDRLPLLLNVKDDYGAEPLHYCESAAVCEQLLSRGSSINAMDFAAKTPLCNAVAKGLELVVDMLCMKTAMIDMPKSTVHNPLHVAIKGTLHTIAAKLIEYGASPNAIDEQGNSPVHIAATGSPRYIMRMLLVGGADTSILNNQGCSALSTAIKHNNIAAVEELSRHNPGVILEPSTVDGTRQSTSSSPLFSIQRDNIIKEVLQPLTVSQLEDVDSAGLNILHHAALTGNFALVCRLIEKNVRLDNQDHQGNTALMLAIHHHASKERNHWHIFTRLVESGASTTTMNHAGDMAWDIALREIDDNSYTILTTLLKHSVEACRKVTRARKVHSPVYWSQASFLWKRETCGPDLVYIAINRADQKLFAALKLRMPTKDFAAAENTARANLPDPLRHYRAAYASDHTLPHVPGSTPPIIFFRALKKTLTVRTRSLRRAAAR